MPPRSTVKVAGEPTAIHVVLGSPSIAFSAFEMLQLAVAETQYLFAMLLSAT